MSMDRGEMLALAEEVREFTAMKYAGDCKCGKCQLVPRGLVERIYHTLNSAALRASAAPEEGEPVADKPENVMRVYNEARKLTPREQYYAAEMIANNVGYELVEEAEHPDSPHAALPPATEDGGREEPSPIRALKQICADVFAEMQGHAPSEQYEDGYSDACAACGEATQQYHDGYRKTVRAQVRALSPSPSVGTPAQTSAEGKTP